MIQNNLTMDKDKSHDKKKSDFDREKKIKKVQPIKESKKDRKRFVEDDDLDD